MGLMPMGPFMSLALDVKVLSVVGLMLVILILVSVRRQQRTEGGADYDHSLAEKVNGILGADGRRLDDTLVLLERSRKAGLAARLHVSGSPRPLPASVDVAGYRIVQEALTNALERGTASATVVIGYQTGGVTLVVDTPIGSRPARFSGLKQMRERAASIGGTVDAGLYQGGWRVQAHLPTELKPS
jgi:hypothetical protein